MSTWLSLFQRPSFFSGEETATDWFQRIAERLLNGTELVVGGKAHRITEVEVYYHGADHADPFAHKDPVQLCCGRWYFHRTNGVYRNASFKGLDLAFGDGVHFGGVLIRGLEKPNGELIDGPSLLVDYLLDATAAETVARLDKVIGTRVAWETGNTLFLREVENLEQRPICRSGRIGLTLKRSPGNKAMQRYVLKPYRYLSQPRKIAKGKPLLVLALHALGKSADEIQTITGCNRGTIERYVADFKSGQEQPDFAPYVGKDLSPVELCRLNGVWYALHGEMAGLSVNRG